MLVRLLTEQNALVNWIQEITDPRSSIGNTIPIEAEYSQMDTDAENIVEKIRRGHSQKA